MTENQDQVLCAANSYIEKFYLNEDYKNLPEDVKQQLQIICVAYTEDVGGVLVMKFSEEGKLLLESISDETDYLYDEIGSELKIREMTKKYAALLKSWRRITRACSFFESPDSWENEGGTEIAMKDIKIGTLTIRGGVFWHRWRV